MRDELTIIASGDAGRIEAAAVDAAIRAAGAPVDCRTELLEVWRGTAMTDAAMTAAAVAALRSVGRAVVVPAPAAPRLRALPVQLGLWTSFTPRRGMALTPRGQRVRFDLRLVRDHHDDHGRAPEFDAPPPWLPTRLAAEMSADTAVAVSSRSPARTERLLTAVCHDALATGRHTVTVVHKGNAFKCTDGVLYQAAQRFAASPDWAALRIQTRIVDNMCAELAQRPEAYDVVVGPALYGDMLDAIITGLRTTPEPVGQVWRGDGTAVYAGRSAAQPAVATLGSFRAAACCLADLGHHGPAGRLDRAVRAAAADAARLDPSQAIRAVEAQLSLDHDEEDV